MYPSRADSTEPPKLSKSQLKKLQKHARTERRKQAKAAAKATTAENSPRATPSLERSIARSAVVSDGEVLSSEAEYGPPESSIETDQEDVSPTPAPAPAPSQPHHESNSNVSVAIESDSTCALFRGVSIQLMTCSQPQVLKLRYIQNLSRNCRSLLLRERKRMSSLPLRLNKMSRKLNAQRNAKIWLQGRYGHSL